MPLVPASLIEPLWVEFAALIGTGVGTVRKWELGTRRPSGAARTLINVIKNEPKAVRRALAKANEVA